MIFCFGSPSKLIQQECGETRTLLFIYFFNLLFFLHILDLIFFFWGGAALGLRCCARAFSSCGERGLLFAAVHKLLIAVASPVAEHGL